MINSIPDSLCSNCVVFIYQSPYLVFSLYKPEKPTERIKKKAFALIFVASLQNTGILERRDWVTCNLVLVCLHTLPNVN